MRRFYEPERSGKHISKTAALSVSFLQTFMSFAGFVRLKYLKRISATVIQAS